jgi:hypothetical protein
MRPSLAGRRLSDGEQTGAIPAALTWDMLSGRAVPGWESDRAERICAGAVALMIAAGSR